MFFRMYSVAMLINAVAIPWRCQLSPTVLDRYIAPTDSERLAVTMRSSTEAIRGMSFAGKRREALEFVAYMKPIWTCR